MAFVRSTPIYLAPTESGHTGLWEAVADDKDENPRLFSLSEVCAVLAMRSEERKLKWGK